MITPRLYQNTELNLGKDCPLTPEAHHHLTRVLRARVGDPIILFNGQGGEYQANITEISRKQTHVGITHFIDNDIQSPLKIHLGQGIARGEKMDFMLQKAVELGVSEITPLFTDKCAVKPQNVEKRITHWERVIISACEQSGQNTLPQLNPCMALPQWLEQCNAHGIIFDPRGDVPISKISRGHEFILLGPESGFSEDEVLLAKQHHWVVATLGPRILRAETATVAGITAMQVKWGDY